MFTSLSCKNGQRNVQNSVVHVQSCCFANKTYFFFFFFLTFSLPSASLDLKVTILQLRDHLSWPACMEIHKVIKRKQLYKTSVKLDCKTARIFAYSSTRAREQSNKTCGTRLGSRGSRA